MAADLSVGAFAADGVAETVIDGQTGYLVPKGDVSALADVTLRLVKDKSLRVRFGRNGRRRVRECFSAQGAAQRVGVIIDAILEAAKR
jgi:glycosyltransferase involved in cell wall biosynthesis